MKQNTVCFEVSPQMGNVRVIVLSNLHVVSDDNINLFKEVVRFLEEKSIKPICEYQGEGVHFLLVSDREALTITDKLTECYARKLNYFKPVNPEVEMACSDMYARHIAKIRREWAAELNMAA